MTRVFLFFVCLITLPCLAIADSKAAQAMLDGVWVLVSAEHQYAGDTQRQALVLGKNFKSYKVIKDGFYSVLTQDVSRDVFGSKMGKFSIDGNVYTEHFIIHNHQELVGDKSTFTFRLDNNRWYIYSDDIVEVWERVPPPTK